MKITVQSIHFDADRKLIDFISDKLQKLNQFTDSIHGADVFLRLEKDGENRENKHVEIRLSVPGPDLFASRRGKSFEEAVIGAVEALRTQVTRKADLRKAS